MGEQLLFLPFGGKRGGLEGEFTIFFCVYFKAHLVTLPVINGNSHCNTWFSGVCNFQILSMELKFSVGLFFRFNLKD